MEGEVCALCSRAIRFANMMNDEEASLVLCRYAYGGRPQRSPASGYGGWYAAEKERKEDRSKI